MVGTRYRRAMTATGQPDPDLGPTAEGPGAVVRGLALLTRFALEIALLVAVAWCAYAAAGPGLRWPAAVLAPIVVGVVWGMWLSPRAAHRPSPVVRVLIEAVLFGGAGVVLWALGHPLPGGLLAWAWVVDRAALAVVPRAA